MIGADFFRELFVTFLEEYQPQMAGDHRLIASRSQAAAKTFHEIYDKGYDYQAAMERAYLELTDGLRESLYKFLYGWVSEDYAAEIPETVRKEFCMAALPDCQKIMDRYTYSEMDSEEAGVRMQAEFEEIIRKRLVAQ